MTADLTRLLSAAERPGFISVCHRGRDMVFQTAVLEARKASPQVAKASATESDVWVSVARVAGPARTNQGRGKSREVQALTALPIDLDVKLGGMPTWEAARSVVTELSEILGVEPTALVNSGHGLQPWFILDGHDPAWTCDGPEDPRWSAMVAMSRRWGRLVSHVAAKRGGAADSAFDVARLMRCPGTTNYKDRDKPVPVAVESWTDAVPLAYDRLDAALVNFGVDELPEDREVVGDVVVASGDWTWAEQTCPYASAMTAGWTSDAPRALGGVPGARHPWLLAQGVRLAAAHRHGCLTKADHAVAVATLDERFADIVSDSRYGDIRAVAPGEVSGCLAWGVVRVEAMSDADAVKELGAHLHCGGAQGQMTGVDVATGAGRPLADLVFDSTPELAYLRELAHARLVSPWTVLAGALGIVLAEAPPFVKIPPFVGTAASLNSFFAIVGPSGSGKTAGVDVAQSVLASTEAVQRNPSSGEGIITLFVSTPTKGDQIQHTTNVLSVVDEVATLGAQMDRKGSTLAPILRSAWSGSALSTNAAERVRQRNLDANSYRFVMIMGVQPATAGLILDDHGAGTPQRVVWLPAQYAGFPEVDVRPGENPFEDWEMPKARSTIAFPDHIRALVRANRIAAMRGDVEVIDGHALLARLKVAAALALLHGTTEVNDLLWEISGHIMALSDHTRSQLLRHQSVFSRERQEARGLDEAIRDEAKDRIELERGVKVLATYVHRRAEGVTRKQAKDACGRYKHRSVELISISIERGLIVEEQTASANGKTGYRYRPGLIAP